MDCLVLPCYVMKRRRRSGSRLSYRRLKKAGFDGSDGSSESPVMVVVGKEKRVFFVDPFVLEENPFRVLIETQKVDKGGDDHKINWDIRSRGRERRMIFVDVDAILFEHLLWLMYNDCSSLLKLNVEEIMDFYAQDC